MEKLLRLRTSLAKEYFLETKLSITPQKAPLPNLTSSEVRSMLKHCLISIAGALDELSPSPGILSLLNLQQVRLLEELSTLLL
ncbi:Uncharacterised protein [Chlamydia trachomatis]|nr:Uncharacterised protein [Chlamydia trachomatis]CRH48535.1 Uncharacterised protein [Chlamydia trachomatis]